MAAAMQGGLWHADEAPCLVGAGLILPERCPLMLQPGVLMASATVRVPMTRAISLDGTIKSPQIAPECTLLKADSFETDPSGFSRRRKQQIGVFFLYQFGGEVAIIWK